MSEATFFTIGEVAAMVGVSPHTIRAWERRNHVLTPERTADRSRAAAAGPARFGRRVDLRVNLRPAAGSEAYAFDCWRLAQPGEPRLAVIGRPLDPDALPL